MAAVPDGDGHAAGSDDGFDSDSAAAADSGSDDYQGTTTIAHKGQRMVNKQQQQQQQQQGHLADAQAAAPANHTACAKEPSQQEVMWPAEAAGLGQLHERVTAVTASKRIQLAFCHACNVCGTSGLRAAIEPSARMTTLEQALLTCIAYALLFLCRSWSSAFVSCRQKQPVMYAAKDAAAAAAFSEVSRRLPSCLNRCMFGCRQQLSQAMVLLNISLLEAVELTSTPLEWQGQRRQGQQHRQRWEQQGQGQQERWRSQIARANPPAQQTYKHALCLVCIIIRVRLAHACTWR